MAREPKSLIRSSSWCKLGAREDETCVTSSESAVSDSNPGRGMGAALTRSALSMHNTSSSVSRETSHMRDQDEERGVHAQALPAAARRAVVSNTTISIVELAALASTKTGCE